MLPYYTKEELELDAIWLKQSVARSDWKEVAAAASRIKKVAEALKPNYEYEITLSEYERIMNTLQGVSYGVGGYLPEVVW